MNNNNTDDSTDSIKLLTVPEMIELGLVFEINRKVLHPLGLSLMYDVNTKEILGCKISPDDEFEYSTDTIIRNSDRICNFRKNKETILKHKYENSIDLSKVVSIVNHINLIDAILVLNNIKHQIDAITEYKQDDGSSIYVVLYNDTYAILKQPSDFDYTLIYNGNEITVNSKRL